MMRCECCGTENETDAKFCIGCGKKLQQVNFLDNQKNGKEIYSGTASRGIYEMENIFPSSIARAEMSSSTKDSVLIHRIAFAVAVAVSAFIVVMAAVVLIQSLVGNEQRQPKSSDNQQESSSSYNSQGWSSETAADSSDSSGIYDQEKTDNYSDTGNMNYSYTYDWNDDEDNEDDEGKEDNEEADTYEGDYIFPNSDSKKLTKADLRNMTSEELRLGRNEIYARHGRLFDDEELQEYFDEQSWYVGTIEPSEFVDSQELNDIERRNAKFILKYEKSN